MTVPDSIRIEAPAKINLFLKVLGRRADGYHDIYSLVQTVDLFDALTFTRAKLGISLKCDSDDVPKDESNLVWKAAALLHRKMGLPAGVKIELHKRIPVGAGLGGGSSDAAATLKGLNNLFELGLQGRELAALAVELGSDVPLFFSTGQCLISGRGEVVETVRLPTNYRILLILPDFRISTSWAYQQLRFPLTRSVPQPTFNLGNMTSQSFYKSLTDIGNDFMDIVVHEHPDLEMVISKLRLAGAPLVQLSGSGSAFFGLFEREPDIDVNALFGDRIGWKALILNPVWIEASHTYKKGGKST